MANYVGDRHAITPEILLRAYAAGMFPMAESAEDPEVFWVQPRIRGVIPLDRFHVSKSLAKKIRRKPFEITLNKAFDTVMERCAEATDDRPTTWINPLILSLYKDLHRMGYTHSVEAWDGEELVGGLYGVSLGSAFFGESMFSRRADASKICLVHLVGRLRERKFTLLDTQFTTDHLKTFGAIDIPRKDYEKLLEEAMKSEDLEFADP